MTDRQRRMRARPRWWIAAAQAFVLLPFVRLMLLMVGYRRTMRVLAIVDGTPSPHEQAAVPEAVKEVSGAVMAVGRLLPIQTRCLARSITIWFLSRRRAHAVNVVIGVATTSGRHEFAAHAWVEYAAIPVNDSADVRTRYAVLAISPP